MVVLLAMIRGGDLSVSVFASSSTVVLFDSPTSFTSAGGGAGDSVADVSGIVGASHCSAAEVSVTVLAAHCC